MTIQAVSNQPAATMAAATSAKPQQASTITQPAGTRPSSSTTTQPSQSSASYTVSISNSAHAALAEAAETSVQTAQEASKGDHQAQHLLAKERANKVA